MRGHWKTCPWFMRKCSTTGPRLRAGKKVSAPTMTMTPTSSEEKSALVTGNVPADAGITFLRLNDPAMASGGMIMKKRPNSIATPSVELNHLLLALRPPNADPLFAAADE